MHPFSPKAKRIPKTANRDDDYGGGPSPPEEEESSRRAGGDHCEFETTENCHLLEKALSMNDDLLLEMNSYPDERSPMMVIADRSRTIKTTSPLVTICELQTNRIAESARFTIPWRSDDNRKRVSEFAEDARSSHDRRDSFGSSTRKSVSRQNDKLGAPNLDRKRLKRTNNDRHFDVAAKKVGERLATNWREFRKTFAHLLRGLDGKVREKDVERNASLLSRSKDFVVDREFCYSPVSPFVSLLSPRNCEESTTSGRNVARTFLASEEARQSDESPRRRAEDVASGVHQGSVTPYSGSSPSARRCRTTLKFEDEEAQKQSTANRVDIRDRLQITNSPCLPAEKKSEEHSAFSPSNPPACDNARLKSRDSLRLISRSTSICNRDFPLLPEHRDKSLQEEKCQNDLHDCTCCAQENAETLHNSREHVPRRRSVPCAVIFGFTAFCLWLIQKLLHLLNSGYERLRRAIVPFSSSETISSQSPRTKELGLLVATLRSDNERMLYMLSEKVNRLSADFVQVRTSTETTINVLTAEVREIGRQVKENNMLLMQELKNLQEKLKEIRLNSMRTTPLSSSCRVSSPPQPPPSPAVASVLIPPPPPLPPSSSLPPPPPPPLPPPSSLLFSQRKHISVSPMRPLLSALPSVPLQSPTTPNSTRNNRRVTPTRKCSTPLLNRPSITVEDLLQVTLKKPQSIKDNRWNTIPAPRGPVVSLDMLRSVKLKSVRRRSNDQTGRSPRRRIIKGRNAPSLTLSPIMTGSEGNLERILRQVDANRRNPRRLTSGSISFREHNFTSDEMQQSVEMLKHNQSSQSVIA